MKFLGPCTFFAGVAAITFGLASPAVAQQIHHYEDAAPTQPATIPGASLRTGSPQNVDASGARSKTGSTSESTSDDGGENQVGYSNEVRMNSASSGTNQGNRETLDLKIDKLYRGVIPGTRDKVAHLSQARKKGQNTAHRNELTWLGFEPTDAYTRVFFQTARKADYQIRRKQNPAMIEITLRNTEIAARNFSRFIDTSFFGRNVQRVETTKIDASTLKITVELTNFEQPTVRESDNYIYLDFPHKSAKSTDTASQKSASTSTP